MSHFEYISVALSLLYALAMGRMLGGLMYSISPEKGYVVHAAWIFQLILALVLQWWVFWNFNSVEWTPD